MGSTTKFFVAAFFLTAAVWSGKAVLAAPAVSQDVNASSEQQETAALNLQSLKNAQIVNPPDADANTTSTTTQPPSAVPNVGSARGGGQRAGNLGGAVIGKARSRGTRGGKRKRHHG